MSLSWECKAKLIKQLPAKPTERRGPVSGESHAPGPGKYSTPTIFCGNGYSKIKRAPAYTFGYLTKSSFNKSSTTPNAPMFDLRGKDKKGQFRITHSVVSPPLESSLGKTKVPGPGAYTPRYSVRYKRPPAYSLRRMPAPPFKAKDQWTPSSNMYCPPIPCKNLPAYTFGNIARTLKTQELPGPGEHKPNFDYVKRAKPAFSFGHPFRQLKPPKIPPPNTYCEKKFMVSKRTSPAPSFGIRHSQYSGQQDVYLRSSKLDVQVSNVI